jgi:hypothetical protein
MALALPLPIPPRDAGTISLQTRDSRPEVVPPTGHPRMCLPVPSASGGWPAPCVRYRNGK